MEERVYWVRGQKVHSLTLSHLESQFVDVGDKVGVSGGDARSVFLEDSWEIGGLKCCSQPMSFSFLWADRGRCERYSHEIHRLILG